MTLIVLEVLEFVVNRNVVCRKKNVVQSVNSLVVQKLKINSLYHNLPTCLCIPKSLTLISPLSQTTDYLQIQ